MEQKQQPTANDIYRKEMEFPMESLAIELFRGIPSNDQPELFDHELVSLATKKIKMLKDMLLATGFNEQMLKACMAN